MPRSRRLWDPDDIHHVAARAHDGAPIFREAEDRAFVVGRAARVFREEGIECLGWSILENHYHFLIRCPGPPGPAMQRLNTAVAGRIRRRFGGRGAVFQDRFFSEPCKDEASLQMRLAYVTANAVHHRLIPTIERLLDCRWSSLGEAMGLRPALLTNVAAVLALADPSGDTSRARAAVIELLEWRAREWARAAAAGAPPEDRELGETPVVRPEMDAACPAAPATAPGKPACAAPCGDRTELAGRRRSLRAAGWQPDRLVVVACGYTGADVDSVRRGRRTRREARARALVAAVACRHLGWPLADVARVVGTSAASVVRCAARGSKTLTTIGVDADELLRRAGA